MFFDGEYCSPCRLEPTKKYLYGTSVISLKRWQEMWFMLLCACSEVRCFSNSSKEILNEAYPMLNEKLVTIVPHDMLYCHNTRIKDIDKRPFHIGIVGACHYEIKRREVVIDVLEEFGDSVPISIIGSSYRDYHIERKW